MPVTKLDLRIVEIDVPAYIIAAKAGFSPSRLSEYRNGRKAIPAHHLIGLARVLQCNPDELVGIADERYLSAG